MVNHKDSKNIMLEEMAHKLKTPLQNIIGYAELMKEDDISEQNLKRCKIIAEAGKNLNELIDFCCNQRNSKKYNHKLRANLFSLGGEFSRLSKQIKQYDKPITFKTFFEDQELCNTPLVGDNIRFREMLFNLFEWITETGKCSNLTINIFIASLSTIGNNKRKAQVEIKLTSAKDSLNGEEEGKRTVQNANWVKLESNDDRISEFEYFNSSLFEGRYLISQLDGLLEINGNNSRNLECRVLIPFQRINGESNPGKDRPEFNSTQAEFTSISGKNNCAVDIEKLLSDLSKVAPEKVDSLVDAIELLDLNRIIKLISCYTEHSDVMGELCRHAYSKNYKAFLHLQDVLEQQDPCDGATQL